MTTYCNILRNNKTMGKLKIKDNKDDFIFEGGTYFVQKEKVFLDKTSVRGKIKPTLLYIEGVAQALYLDNVKLKEYYADVKILDNKTKKPILDENGKPKTELKKLYTVEDIFIDARAIHNMTDKKILVDLSAQEEFSTTSKVLIILMIVVLIFSIINIFVP
jgi:hypothetical protein